MVKVDSLINRLQSQGWTVDKQKQLIKKSTGPKRYLYRLKISDQTHKLVWTTNYLLPFFRSIAIDSGFTNAISGRTKRWYFIDLGVWDK